MEPVLLTNAPWIGQFCAEDGVVTFFVFVEQSVFCTVTTLSKAIFIIIMVFSVNAPWIGQFCAEDGVVTFFVSVEQSVFCTVTTLSKAIFILIMVFSVLCF